MVLKLMLATMAAAAIRSSRDMETPRSPVSAALDELEMAPAPIDPSLVVEGDPQARLSVHSRAYDDKATTAVWDCTAGAFRWYFGWEETVMILEGEVRVTAEDGSERLLRAGDVAYFPAKSWSTWYVETYVRKLAFCRKEFPAPFSMALKLRDRLRRTAEPRGLAA